MKKVLFVGDSITHGFDWASVIDFAQVQNIAVPGYTTGDVFAQMSEIERIKPDLISLMIGTNDFGNHELNRSGEDTGKRVVSILQLITNSLPNTKLIVNSIAPRGEDFAARIAVANKIIKAYQHANVEYLDLWPTLATGKALNDAYLLKDGFDGHLEVEGYAAWREVLFPRIEAALGIN